MHILFLIESTVSIVTRVSTLGEIFCPIFVQLSRFYNIENEGRCEVYASEVYRYKSSTGAGFTISVLDVIISVAHMCTKALQIFVEVWRALETSCLEGST